MARHYSNKYFLMYLRKGTKSSPPVVTHPPQEALHAAADLKSIDDILKLVDDDLSRHDPSAAQEKLLAQNFIALVRNVRRALPHFEQAIALDTRMTHRQVVTEIRNHISAAWRRIEEIKRQNA